MRITRDTLLKLARDTATQRARRSRGLVAIYLTGSLLFDQPLLGGVTDIDLVLVHSSEPPYPREVIRLTDEIHLDLAHYSSAVFAQPRRLRSDPWLGSYLCANPIALYDLQHWFDFTQASVCAQFDLPENVILRARPLAEAARQAWFELQSTPEPGPDEVGRYLRLLENAGNALALLGGPPLPLRRYFLLLPERAEALGRPGMADGLADLLGPGRASFDWQRWLPAWQTALESAAQSPDCPPRLAAARIPYYTRAAEALRDDHADAALWIMLNTWTDAVRTSGSAGPDYAAALDELELGGQAFAARLEAVDAYLDSAEETLDTWADQHGVEPA